MGEICIVLPPPSLYVFGQIVAYDMTWHTELFRACPGEVMCIRADGPVEIGIAFGRGRTPGIRLRFAAQPGRIYRLFWLENDFGTGMGVE